MKRRSFIIRSSAGIAFTLIAPGLWGCLTRFSKKEEVKFKVYKPGQTLVPVTKVTPDDGFYIHTYYDVCPFSPSGRYLIVSKLPYENRPPQYGDEADVCIIDLENQLIETIYTTKCWAHQTGTMAQWGATDEVVYTNDLINGTAVSIEINLKTKGIRALEGPLYHISPDGKSIIGFPLELYDITQRGYGLVAKDYNNPPTLPMGASDTEGIWKTNTGTGKKSLLVSIKDVAGHIPELAPREDGTYYFWHSKFNLQSNRIMLVQRCLFPDNSGGNNVNVFTLDVKGNDIKRTFSEPVWGHFGGHPNWHPDGKHLIRNLQLDGKRIQLCKVPIDGSNPIVLSETIDGGGHPTIEPSERYIVTDAMYQDPDPVVRIRLINLIDQTEEAICKMPTKSRLQGGGAYFELRLDGHPVWDHSFNRICFQAAPNGHRQLFIADLSSLKP